MPRSALHREHAPPLQALLFWQVCLVCAVLGILALQWSHAALLGLGLLFWTDSRLHILWHIPEHSPTQLLAQTSASLPPRPLTACRILLALTCFAAAWGTGYALLPPVPDLPPWAMRQNHEKEYPRLRGIVENVQGLTDQRLRITLKSVTLDTPATAPASTPTPSPSLNGKVVWTWDKAPVRPLHGESWAFSLPVNAVTSTKNLGLADWSFASRTQEHLWRVWSKELRGNPQKLEHLAPASSANVQREALRQKVVAALQGEQNVAIPLTQAQAIIPALLFGDRSALHSSTIDLFTKATLIHSLALSGQHLAVTIVFATVLVGCMARFFSLTFLWVPRIKAIVACALPLALLYLWLGNAPASLQRAACMMAILCICLWRNTSMTTLDILCGAVLCLLLWNPLSLYDVGLQLSVLCVGTIALIVPILRDLPSFTPFPKTTNTQSTRLQSMLHSLGGLGRALVSILLISCAIQIVLLPVSLLLFHTTSPWFFLNVLWLPVLGCVVLPASVLLLVFSAVHLPDLAHLCASVAIWPCEILLRLLEWLHSYNLLDEILFLRPHWTALLGYASLLLAALLLWGRPGLSPACRRLAIAGALLLLISPLLRYAEQSSPNIRLRMLDVGQGQALALELPHGKTLLIDGGGTYSSRFDVGQAIVSPTLTYNRPPRVESLINSHPHADHLKGLLYINKHFQVQQWHDNNTLAAGDRLLLQQQPRIILEVLHPPRNTRYTKENDNSLVLRLVVEGPNGPKGLALFTGDIEREALDNLLAQGHNIQAEVLVLPHHGSKTSFSPALYAAVNPQVAFISYGANNRYGSPVAEVISSLKQRSLRIFRSAEHGQVNVEWLLRGENTEGGFASLRLPPAGD